MNYELDLGEDVEAYIDNILEWWVIRFCADIRDGYAALLGAALEPCQRSPGTT